MLNLDLDFLKSEGNFLSHHEHNSCTNKIIGD